MNLITLLRVVLGEVRRRPGRALLPGVALVVGVACLTASLLLGDAMRGASKEGRPRIPAAVGLVVEPADVMADVSEAFGALESKLAAVPGVRRVVPVREAGVDLLLDEGRSSARQAVLDVEVADDALRRIPIAEGRSPAADGEVAVDRVMAHYRGLRPGSTLPVADAQGRPTEVVVSGITLRGSGEERRLVGGPALAARIAPKTTTSELDLVLAPGADVAAVSAAVSGVVGSAFQVVSPEEARPSIESGGVDPFLLFSILALATAVFVAAATFRAVYLQRQRQTALLRCLGSDRGPLVVANLVEAVLTGAFSGVVGALLGGPAAWALAQVLDATKVSALLGAVQLDPPLLPTSSAFVAGVVTAAVLSVVAAVRPALGASLVPPLVALRTAEEAPPERALSRGRHVLGWTAAGVAVLCAVVSLLGRGSMAGPMAALFSAIAAVVALFMAFGPVTVPWISRLFGAAAGRLGGTTWRLAALEVRRVPHRAAAVALPLVLASALVTFGLTTMGGFAAVSEEGARQPRADAVVQDSGSRPLSAEAVRAAAQGEGVAATVALHVTTGTVPDRQGDGQKSSRGGGAEQISIAGADPAAAKDVLARVGISGENLSRFGEGAAMTNPAIASQLGLQPGQEFTVDGLPGGPRKLRFAGTYSYSLMQPAVLLADPGVAAPDTVLVALRPGADQAAYQASVRRALTAQPTVLVETKAGRAAQDRTQFEVVSTLFAVLLGLSVAVAVTGIGTALTISVQERRKELALRRALGVHRRAMRHGLVAEAVILALVGLVGGGVLGAGYSWLVLFGFSETAMPSAPVWTLGIGAVAVVVLAALSALGPARTAGRIAPAAGLASG
ncbi:putative ABC transport system permease protein [Streptoalloteichus tenebrarius]|uniref:ABC transport system permease protein n=1 Tax=Streptoalloteichus tenebrarius (strain ATCC 17920 / DSM 40477 / JCM 4838 / CBS 697.72 / NBRC 16177 / NCIMB 11028 / NRRL B-12390 / A12253. 1 / ISP 5477) TaxID=1933 RepID=A0ABT1HP72_STRSD|nr:FtsX-like permease family protein [Streptoalloteichus tenebrarius]MCP2257316.1 putative ABC transport system permease protein [Streptoalloteichus tenebrarius]